jgi:hypothetical protein
MTPNELIASWCEATRGVEENYGREKAMGYLIGEKFFNYLEGAEADGDWRQAIPISVAEIKSIFEPCHLAEFLNTPRSLGALGHVAGEETHRMFREGLEAGSRAVKTPET